MKMKGQITIFDIFCISFKAFEVSNGLYSTVELENIIWSLNENVLNGSGTDSG